MELVLIKGVTFLGLVFMLFFVISPLSLVTSLKKKEREGNDY